jgi:hypothetical protein
MNLILLTYNNYSNRIVKRSEVLNDYLEGNLYQALPGLNFNPNDDITTEHIINWNNTWKPDYMLVTDSENNIVSRWFVIDMVRTRGKQYNLRLRHDVVADHYNEIISAPCFIEKATLSGYNPLVFNNEGLGFNQIKTEEILLKDGSECPWIVGYIAKDAQTQNPINVVNNNTEDYISVSASSLDSWEYGSYITQDFVGQLYNKVYTIKYLEMLNGVANAYATVDLYEDNVDLWVSNVGNVTSLRSSQTRPNVRQAFLNNYSPESLITPTDNFFNAHTNSQVSDLLYYNGKIIKLTNGKFYRIRVVATQPLKAKYQPVTNSNNLFNSLQSLVTAANVWDSGYSVADNKTFSISAYANCYRVIAEEVSSLNTSFTLPSTRQASNDSLYDMFCLPFGDAKIYSSSDASLVFTADKEINLNIANSLITALGQGAYDIQILPYCPIQSAVNNGYVTVSGLTEGVDFSRVKDPDNKTIAIILYPKAANFTFDINKEIALKRPHEVVSETLTDYVTNTEYSIPTLTPDTLSEFNASTYTLNDGITLYKRSKQSDEILETFDVTQLQFVKDVNPENNSLIIVTANNTSVIYPREYTEFYFTYIFTSATTTPDMDSWRVFEKLSKSFSLTYENSYAYDLKVSNECDVYRLVSPNYQGEFEFSVAKNGGVAYFNVDCTYKPYNPYIHINPNFKLMYGQDFNDSRGLVCNGDFSIGKLTDAFTTYELQNKNYEAIFNRQIQNMDVNNSIARQEATAQMIAGSLQGGTTGLAVGAMIGGIPGAIVGAATGTATSVVGGIADLANMTRRQEEARSFTVDMYNYNLQNIRALPYSMTKCSALTYNNKFFPFVEYYTCTDEEKEMLRNKLLYDGMTIMTIGNIENYLQTTISFIKGQIIRLPELVDDSHTADEIYKEISKGVYI